MLNIYIFFKKLDQYNRELKPVSMCYIIALVILLIIYNTNKCSTEVFKDKLGSYYAHSLTQPVEQYYTYLPQKKTKIYYQ